MSVFLFIDLKYAQVEPELLNTHSVRLVMTSVMEFLSENIFLSNFRPQ